MRALFLIEYVKWKKAMYGENYGESYNPTIYLVTYTLGLVKRVIRDKQAKVTYIIKPNIRRFISGTFHKKSISRKLLMPRNYCMRSRRSGQSYRWFCIDSSSCSSKQKWQQVLRSFPIILQVTIIDHLTFLFFTFTTIYDKSKSTKYVGTVFSNFSITKRRQTLLIA